MTNKLVVLKMGKENLFLETVQDLLGKCNVQKYVIQYVIIIY